MSVISTYELIYKKMSNETRYAMTSDIDAILEESIKNNIPLFKEGVEKAVSAMYESIVYNPWPEYLKSNACLGSLVDSLQEHIWDNLCSTNPTEIYKSKMSQLIKSLIRNFPDETKAVMSELVNDEIKSVRYENEGLQKSLAYFKARDLEATCRMEGGNEKRS